MAGTFTELHDETHEEQARHADRMRALSEQRYKEALERQERAELLARQASTDAERERHLLQAKVHRDAALCQLRAGRLFAAHRDHERRFAERMENLPVLDPT